MNQPCKWRHIDELNWHDETSAVLVDGLSPDELAIKTDNGYVTMDRDGNTRYSPNMGPWEGSYKLDSDLPILRITPNVVTYCLEVAER